jgi:hypothetical protein
MREVERPDGVLVCVGPDFHARAAIEPREQGYRARARAPDLADSWEVWYNHSGAGIGQRQRTLTLGASPNKRAESLIDTEAGHRIKVAPG